MHGGRETESSNNPRCALRSRAELGLSARTHEKAGALLERWRAQCGTTSPTIHHRSRGQLPQQRKLFLLLSEPETHRRIPDLSEQPAVSATTHPTLP